MRGTVRRMALVGLAMAAAGGLPAPAAASAAPSTVGLQLRDVPGFAAADASDVTLRDPTDRGLAQAFIRCAGTTPLLDAFDGGSAASVSETYSRGSIAGTTHARLALASVVFADGSASDARAAYAALASPSFRSCWASNMDVLRPRGALGDQSGSTAVAPLATPRLGVASTGFVMRSQYTLLHFAQARLSVDVGVAVVEADATVVMLVTVARNAAFPDSVRTNVLDAILRRLRDMQPAGQGSCTAPGDPSPPLLTDADVNRTVAPLFHARSFRSDGWDSRAFFGTGRWCTWSLPGRPPPNQIGLWISSPFAGPQDARKEFDSQRNDIARQKGPPRPIPDLGESAVWYDAGADAGGPLVLSGDRITWLDVPAGPGIISLARRAASRLGELTCTPEVDSVSTVVPAKRQTITISGRCLGTMQPLRFGDSEYLRIADAQGWNACSSLDPGGDSVRCGISSWTDSRIVITAVSATDPGGCLPPGQLGPEPASCSTAPLRLGDRLCFEVWNPLSGAGPATATATVEHLPGGSYAQGAALAEEIDRSPELRAGGDPWTAPRLREIGSRSGDREFALGLLDKLDAAADRSLARAVADPRRDRRLVDLTLTGYAAGPHPGLTYAFYDLLGRSGGPSQDEPLMTELERHPTAATRLFADLTPDQIEHWSRTDQGFFGSDGPVEQTALAVVRANMVGYADPPAYAGPLDGKQLMALMYAATRDPTQLGLGVATNMIGQWFLSHGGRPDGADPRSVWLWLAPLVNMNGAVAAPTAAYLQNIEDWLQRGEEISLAVATTALSFVPGPIDVGIDLLGKALVKRLVTSGLKAAAAVQEADRYEVILATWRLAEVARAEVETVKLGYDIWDKTNAIVEAGQQVHDAIDKMSASAGLKTKLWYYLGTVLPNTYHEAVARLIQEHLLLDDRGRVVDANTAAQVTAIAKHPRHYELEGGTPLLFVWSGVWSQFVATHAALRG